MLSPGFVFPHGGTSSSCFPCLPWFCCRKWSRPVGKFWHIWFPTERQHSECHGNMTVLQGSMQLMPFHQVQNFNVKVPFLLKFGQLENLRCWSAYTYIYIYIVIYIYNYMLIDLDTSLRNMWDLSTLPETNIAPENRPSQKETSIPTIHFQGTG